MSRTAIITAWAIGAAATAGAVVFGVIAVTTAIAGEVVIDRAIPFVVFVVFAVLVGLQVLTARRAGVPERYFNTEGPGSLLRGVVATAIGVYAAASFAAGYERVDGAVVMCGLTTLMCIRSAGLASQSIQRSHPSEPGKEDEPCKTP
jgi:hypothetical protein